MVLRAMVRSVWSRLNDRGLLEYLWLSHVTLLIPSKSDLKAVAGSLEYAHIDSLLPQHSLTCQNEPKGIKIGRCVDSII